MLCIQMAPLKKLKLIYLRYLGRPSPFPSEAMLYALHTDGSAQTLVHSPAPHIADSHLISLLHHIHAIPPLFFL